jgi:GDPmannose 4,6-dehydratase
MYLILQQDRPDDYVIATGITTTIRDFIKTAAAEVGLELTFTGKNTDERGYLTAIDESLFTEKVGEKYLSRVKSRIIKTTTRISSLIAKQSNLKASQQPIVAVDPRYFRPTEVDLLIGDNTKARQKLGWEPRYDLHALIVDMMQGDIMLMKKESYLKDGGYKIMNYFE